MGLDDDEIELLLSRAASEEKHRRWTSLSAVIAAVSALITAIGTALAAVINSLKG